MKTGDENCCTAELQLVDSSNGFCEISTTGYHNLARTVTGKVFVWGNDDGGRLGLGKLKTVVPTPRNLPFPEPITQVSAGEAHNLALTKHGRVYAWGINKYGQ